MRITILGAGSSAGTPAVGEDWGRCNPGNPRNRRTRPALLLEHGSTRLLIDTPPDLRQQLLAAGVSALSGVLYTHAHADHLHGLDDLRGVNRAMRAALPVFSDQETLNQIHQRFGYALAPLSNNTQTFYRPALTPTVIEEDRAFAVGDIEITAFGQDHGFSRSLGFRLGSVAYSTDLVALPDAAFSLLRGVRLWIIGTLTERPHPAHCHVDKALQWLDRVAPDQAILTHLGNELDYEALAARLPRAVRPAFDGLVRDDANGFAADSAETDPPDLRLLA